MTEEIIVPQQFKPYMNREVNFKLFQEILMERIDKSRVTIKLQEFQRIEFSEMGFPRLLTRIFALLLQEQHRVMVERKARLLYDDDVYQRLLPVDTIQEEDQKNDGELFELRNIVHFLEGVFNFPLYEALFRTMCYNPEVEGNWMLRATLDSLSKGLKRWYGGRENLPLAHFLFNYIGKGKVNHQITFSEFVSLVRDLSLAKVHVNLLIYKAVTEGQPELTLLQLLRQYVCTPKGSRFAKELNKLINHYMRKYLDVAPGTGHKIRRTSSIHTLDYETFRELIPYSRLAAELVNKLVDLPPLVLEPETGAFKARFFDDMSDGELQAFRESSMFSPDPEEMDPNKTQMWRQSRQMWSKMRGSTT